MTFLLRDTPGAGSAKAGETSPFSHVPSPEGPGTCPEGLVLDGRACDNRRMGLWTSDTIRLAWWAMPVLGVALASYLTCRALRRVPALPGALAGCLAGAFVPLPRGCALYHDAEAAYMGGLRETLSHTLWWSSWGAVAGGVIATVAWARWTRRARKRV